MKRFLLLLTILLCAASPAYGAGARLNFTHPRVHRAYTEAAMGDVLSLGCTNLPMGNAVRIILSLDHDPADYAACIDHAAQRYRVLLDVQYGSLWPMSQIVARFHEVLDLYGGLHPFAVSIGNEQELAVSYGANSPVLPTSVLAKLYSKAWKQVAPMVHAAWPSAKLVAGEVSPWGTDFMVDAAQDGLPGAQAYAAHVYPGSTKGAYTGPGYLQPSIFERIAQAHHAAAWATEGLCGPGAWMRYGCRSMSELHNDGYSLAAEWYDNSSTTYPVATLPPTESTS